MLAPVPEHPARRAPIPPPWHPRLPARLASTLAALACLQVGALLVTFDRPVTGRVDVAAAAPSPTTAAPTSTAITTAGRTVDAAPPVTATPSTATTAPASPTVAIDPGPLRPPVAGTYRIRVVGDDSKSDGQLTVDRSGAEVMRVSGSTSSRMVQWSSGGGALVASHDAAEPDCIWSPAPLMVPADLHEGRTWSSRSSCTTDGADGPTTVTRDEDAAVTGRARTSVDGAPVDCWLVRRHVVERMQSGDVTATTESVRSELFAPQLGLVVYAVERMDVPAADGSVQSAVWSTELLSSQAD